MIRLKTTPDRMISTPHGLVIADRNGVLSLTEAQAGYLAQRVSEGHLRGIEEPEAEQAEQTESLHGGGAGTDAPAANSGSKDAPTQEPGPESEAEAKPGPEAKTQPKPTRRKT